MAGTGLSARSVVDCAEHDRGRIVAALDQATYLDSNGIPALLTAAERLRVMRQRLLVVAAAGTIARRVLELAGASGIISMLNTVSEALGHRAES